MGKFLRSHASVIYLLALCLASSTVKSADSINPGKYKKTWLIAHESTKDQCLGNEYCSRWARMRAFNFKFVQGSQSGSGNISACDHVRESDHVSNDHVCKWSHVPVITCASDHVCQWSRVPVITCQRSRVPVITCQRSRVPHVSSYVRRGIMISCDHVT